MFMLFDKFNLCCCFLCMLVVFVLIVLVVGCDLYLLLLFVMIVGNVFIVVVSVECVLYKLIFFDVKEWVFVQVVVDWLILVDVEGFGVFEVGVLEFIDCQMEMLYVYGVMWYMQGLFQQGVFEFGYQLKLVLCDIYWFGIVVVNCYCEKVYGKVFVDFDVLMCDMVFGVLEKGGVQIDDVLFGVFFGQLLQNMCEGYFCDLVYGGNCDMVVWKMIGFLGVCVDFMDFVNQSGKFYLYGFVLINGECS